MKSIPVQSTRASRLNRLAHFTLDHAKILEILKW